MLRPYFRNLYRYTMDRAYSQAYREIREALQAGGDCLDCGANQGAWCGRLVRDGVLERDRYHGIEWNGALVAAARGKGINVRQGDLNADLPYEDGRFACVYALSVLEHLLNGCHFLQECRRVLRPGGRLVLLTPNISTYFTALLILAGKMPSSGPHPDSRLLLDAGEIFKVSADNLVSDAESDNPVHRHLVVFSYRVLKDYLHMIGYSAVRGRGYGLYPLPRFLQALGERIDPWHCHQMVFVATR